MKRYKPASGTPKKKPAPFPGGSKPVGGKGKGRGSLTMVDVTTGKRVRKGPTPFPGSPPRGRTKRGKDGIDILIPDKPRKGKGKGIGKLLPVTMPPKKDKGKGKGKVAPPTIDTGKPGRRKKVPLPISPKRGIKIPLGSKPKARPTARRTANRRPPVSRRIR